MRVHLEGMGVIGCGLALRLHRLGQEFTWSDRDLSINAWRACTGAIYPDGHPRGQAGYEGWRRWLSDWEDDASFDLNDYVEQASYWYSSKQPPHRGGRGVLQTVGPLKRSEQNSLHLNAQRFVPAIRDLLADLRTPGPAHGERHVVSHGFSEQRVARYVWGWTRYVKIDWEELCGPSEFRGRAPDRLRPAVYCRPSLVEMAYAYPVPGTDLWYAGSDLIVQHEAKIRSQDEMERCYDRWKERWDRLTGGLLPVAHVTSVFEQGWRPSTGPVSDEDAEPFWEEHDGKLVVMPCWHSGVRWLPAIVAEFEEGYW